MEKDEIIKIINVAISDIETLKSINVKIGLCQIFSEYFPNKKDNIKGEMSYFRERQGITVNLDEYWWLIDRRKYVTSEEWYAPRIEFLQEWEQSLLNETV